MNKTPEQIIFYISNFLNVKETNHFYSTDRETKIILNEKNLKNKRMVLSWLGSLNKYNKLYPLRYFFINKSFDQFMFILKTGVFDNQLTDEHDLNILQIAVRSLDFNKFKLLRTA